MPATAPQNWTKLANWLASTPANGTGVQKKADIPEKEDPNTVAPSDGARSAENAKDTKVVAGSDSVEGGPKNPVHGRADNMGSHHGLEQNTASKAPPANAKPAETIEKENAKISAADLSKDDQLTAAFADLQKAAAALPLLLATSGVPTSPAVASAAAAGARAAMNPAAAAAAQKSAAEKAMLATVETYRKYGSDQADLTVNYLRGFWDTYNYLKQAEDAGALEQMLAGGGGDAGAGGDPGMPPGGGGGGGGPPMDPAAMAAAAEAAGAGGGGEGGPPPEAGPPGPDDHAAAAGELGLSPQELEQLIAILQQRLAAEQGGMAPETKAAVHSALTKAASVVADVKHHVVSGRFQFKPAADGSPERKRRNAARAYFEELRKAAS